MLANSGPNNIIHFPAGSASASGVQALLELVRKILYVSVHGSNDMVVLFSVCITIGLRRQNLLGAVQC